MLATRSGDLFVSHAGHGICRIRPDGTQRVLGPEVSYGGLPLLPNGIALRQDGSFLIANISDAGGIFELTPEGCRPFLTNIAGKAAPPINFVTVDETGRIWFSVSSNYNPRHLAYRRDVRNGFVGIIEDGVARTVIDGLHYTNEIRPDLENGWLYVSETFGQFISRFRLSEDGKIGKKETFAQFPKGAFVDGIALDAEGGLMAACIVSNELFHVNQESEVRLLLHERDPKWVTEVEAALDAGQMNRSHFDCAPTKRLRNIASVAFHGASLDKVICGCLLGEHLISAPSPVQGRPPGRRCIYKDIAAWQ